jgi:hypothetical protein
MFSLFAQQVAERGFQDYEKLIFWGAIVLICCVPSLAYYLYRWRKTELETELKRDMIARGMGADEIERVLGAKLATGEEKSRREARGELKETRMYEGS